MRFIVLSVLLLASPCVASEIIIDLPWDFFQANKAKFVEALALVAKDNPSYDPSAPANTDRGNPKMACVHHIEKWIDDVGGYRAVGAWKRSKFKAGLTQADLLAAKAKLQNAEGNVYKDSNNKWRDYLSGVRGWSVWYVESD